MVIFRSKQKKFEDDLKIRLCGKKRLYPTESVKYLGDTNLSWQYHVKDFSIKRNREDALMFKMRKYVSLKILRSTYFSNFDFYLSYGCPVWAQNIALFNELRFYKNWQLELSIFIQGIPMLVLYSNKTPP